MVKVSTRKTVVEDEDIEEEEDEVRPAPKRSKKSKTATKTVVRRRDEVAARKSKAVVEDEDEDEEDEDEEDDVEDEDDEDEEDEDEEEEDEATSVPARRKKSSGSAKSRGLPPGIRVGMTGAEETRKSGGGADFITLSSEPVLIKFLEDAPFVSYRQHWVSMGSGQSDRPYTCIGTECPLCALADPSIATFSFNVLHLSGADVPKLKILKMGTKAFQALKETATDRVSGKVLLTRGFWAVHRSGKNQQSQTNFRPVKERDIQDDWEEVLEQVALDELPGYVKRAKAHCYDYTVVQVATKKQLQEMAKYLADDDD